MVAGRGFGRQGGVDARKKNKTQSGESCLRCRRDVAQIPAHPQTQSTDTLLKETETQQLCEKKIKGTMFSSIGEKIQGQRTKKKAVSLPNRTKSEKRTVLSGVRCLFQMSRFPLFFFFFIRKEKTMVGIIIKTLTNAQTSQQNMCSFCKDKKKKKKKQTFVYFHFKMLTEKGYQYR